MADAILVMNAGSSSLKFAVFAAADSLGRVLTGRVERVGHGEARLVVSDADGGSDMLEKGSVCAGNDTIQSQLLAMLRAAA